MKQKSMTSMPLDIVGSTKFGFYPKISIEQTFNMLVSDGWLVPYAGYKKIATINPGGQGRGIFNSAKYDHMIIVIDNVVYTVNKNLSVTKIANIDTFNGDVFMDENNANQIAICDKQNIYIFDYVANTFAKASINFLPGYISFQDGYFISVDLKSPKWRLSDPNQGLSWPDDAQHVGGFQTKPNLPLAAIRVPGKGTLLYVFGSTVVESWSDVGYQLFPYQKNQYVNIDYGCVNAATIAPNEDILVWVGVNEKSGPVIMYSTGGNPHQISNDGINFRLAKLTEPSNCYGFLFKQDGHTIYQVTWPADNFSLAYDFTTSSFFTLTDQRMNAHIAKRVVSFNNSYFFVSFIDGNLYEMGSKYTTYDGDEIPRVRVCKNIRMPNQDRFVVDNVTFTMEQGAANDMQRVDVSLSKNGGESFSSYVSKNLNRIGLRQNRFNVYRLGMANDLVLQFRFFGTDRFICTNGVVSMHQ